MDGGWQGAWAWAWADYVIIGLVSKSYGSFSSLPGLMSHVIQFAGTSFVAFFFTLHSRRLSLLAVVAFLQFRMPRSRLMKVINFFSPLSLNEKVDTLWKKY